MSPEEMDFPRTSHLKTAAAARGASLDTPQPLAGDGSDRRFFRLGVGVVLLYHPLPPGGAVTENDSYFRIGRHLAAAAVPVPEIFEYCREEGWMLLEDVGDLSLDAACRGPDRDAAASLWYPKALEVLADMQARATPGFDPAWCFDTPAVDRPFLRERECAYFVRAFLQDYLGLEVNPEDLAPDFERLLALALPDSAPRFFLHRDFQSRNLFIHQGRLRVLDFQGGRLGSPGYDLAALLIDPYMDLSPARQQEFMERYLRLSPGRPAVDEGGFRAQYPYLALCRNLQVLGAYGFLTRKGKASFARHIPAALAGLRRQLQERAGEFPLLEQVVAGL